ncbi:cholesterol 16,22-dihydroxylase CYP90G4-like [Elaeis guineensis]|uniref:cholesterol 16,22-dihydroxylase CYP90G4-like n=1 Tax=Elaeis guineensis var. tenera TaxID=51953 RepID=UPI003C6D8FA4
MKKSRTIRRLRHERDGVAKELEAEREQLRVSLGNLAKVEEGLTAAQADADIAKAEAELAKEALGRAIEVFRDSEEYGKIFKSNLHGAPTIVSADAELNRLRSHFLGDAEQSILQTFSTWVEHTPFPLKEEAIKMSFDLIAKHILSKKPGEPETKQIRKLFMRFMRGAVAVHINLPGTAYRKALKEEHIQRVKLKKERRETGALTWQDYKKMEFTRCVLQQNSYCWIRGYLVLESHISNLNNSKIQAEQRFSNKLVYAYSDVSATAMTNTISQLNPLLAFSFLSNNYNHRIYINNRHLEPHSMVTVSDLASNVVFTYQIVNETLRLGNVIRFVHRKARSNVQFQGYDIPRDWNVIPVFADAHLDPSLHDEPHKFNPWRWQTLSASTTKDDSYMAFSHGIRRCPGQELAKMEITIFLHHFVPNFDWELAELDHPLACPFPEFPKGLPIKVHKLSLDM